MSTSSAWSVALLGMDAQLVEVEASITSGLPRVVMVGLPDTALYESRDRCRAAFAGAGLNWPSQLLTINLTPACLPKAGSHYDLAIVAAVLMADQQAPETVGRRCLFMGELGLDGCARAVRGLLPGLLAARRAGFETAIVPSSQYAEACLVDGLTVWPVADLADLLEVLHGRPVLPSDVPTLRPSGRDAQPCCDLSEVRGQPEACWALEVAAAGGHHLFLHGAPGVGKSMLAQRLPGLLPRLDDEAALEVSAIASLAGLEISDGLVRTPPYANPHHNASMAAMVGGGTKVPHPGAISRAHRGVLFLDEAPEFSPRVLDALRTPLETGEVTIARASAVVRYPARFQLVMAANPCPCGMHGLPGARCSCSAMAVRRYNERLSGPILDRVDIHVRMVPALKGLSDALVPDRSAVVAERVLVARQRMARRLSTTGARTNAEVSGPGLRSLPTPRGLDLLDDAMRHGRLSARGYDKVVRLAWTLADLAGRDVPQRQDLGAAIGLRADEWRAAA